MGQRQRLRERRKKLGVPTVAVIGYTNCGKTSLIKALTQQAELEPKNALFATLDVTCHRTTLPPSNIDVVFIDTVGFISDIPTPLVASFSSTLEDALQADLLLHVRDLSHPDTLNQNTQVLTTLKRLGASKEALDSMVTVGNKVDLVSEEQLLSSPCLPVSATLGLGLDHLARQELVQPLMIGTGFGLRAWSLRWKSVPGILDIACSRLFSARETLRGSKSVFREERILDGQHCLLIVADEDKMCPLKKLRIIPWEILNWP